MKIIQFIKPALSGAAMLWSIASYGQRNSSLPLGVMPMEYNSSFAGESDEGRLNTAFLYDFPDIGDPNKKSHFFGNSVSYDQFIPALRSGIGASLYSSSYLRSSPNTGSTGTMDPEGNFLSNPSLFYCSGTKILH